VLCAAERNEAIPEEVLVRPHICSVAHFESTRYNRRVRTIADALMRLDDNQLDAVIVLLGL
jgi:hypothetical protein